MEDVAGLVAALQDPDGGSAVLRSARRIGAMCRAKSDGCEQTRESIGAQGGIEVMAALLDSPSRELQFAVCAALASACAKNSTNLGKLIRSGAMTALLRILADTTLQQAEPQPEPQPDTQPETPPEPHPEPHPEPQPAHGPDILAVRLAAAGLLAPIAAAQEGSTALWTHGAAHILVAVVVGATSAIDDERTEGQSLLDHAKLRLDCLRALNSVATSEPRCSALLAPSSCLAEACIAVSRHKYDIEGTRCAVSILRNLALAPEGPLRLLAAGALTAFAFHISHKDPNVTACAAAGLRLLVSRSAAAALALEIGTVRSLVEIDIEHTHPHCRVEVARTLANVQCATVDAAPTRAAQPAAVATLLGSASGVAAIGFLLLSNHATLQEEALRAYTAGRLAAARGGSLVRVRARVEHVSTAAGEGDARALAVALLDRAAIIRDPLLFLAGERVHLVGLEKAPQFNGMAGTVLKLEAPTGRYTIRLDDEKKMAVKVVNLKRSPSES